MDQLRIGQLKPEPSKLRGLGHSGRSVPPHGGVGLYGSGYLPANNQGSILQVDQEEPIKNVKPKESLRTTRPSKFS